jgi:hypothetical protein
MKRLIPICLMLLCMAVACSAKLLKEFPSHWGKPPEIQTMDYVELPAGYGHGSSTLAHWIKANLAKDKASAEKGSPQASAVLYKNNFETAELGKLPDGFVVLQGGFAVREDGGNKFLELPGAPLDSFAVQFGPAETDNIAVSARIHGNARGRRFPVFGVGLNGVSGHRLQVSPAKNALELFKDDELKASVPFAWTSDQWTMLRLQVRKSKAQEWEVQGKAWAESEAEPAKWMISTSLSEQPIQGRASVFGSPFSGTPIRFDDLKVSRVGGQGAVGDRSRPRVR